LPYIVFLMDGFIFVSNKYKRQILLLSEFLMRRFAVGTNSYNFISCLLKLVIIISQITSLGRTSGCIIFWIKIYYYFFPPKIRQLNNLSILIFSFEVRCLISNLKL